MKVPVDASCITGIAKVNKNNNRLSTSPITFEIQQKQKQTNKQTNIFSSSQRKTNSRQ
jgi:hypothetical protein